MSSRAQAVPVVKGKRMALGQPLLSESMHAMARQVLGQTDDRQVEVRPLVDGDESTLDEFLAGG